MTEVVFWTFQFINGLTALAMFVAPKKTHESLFREPARAYVRIGFSPIAIEMVHNVIRGQGAALLAVSVFLFVAGPGLALSFLLIGLVCLFSLVAHVCTALHHRRSPVVMESIGSLRAMIPILIINVVFAALGFGLFFNH